MPAATIATIDTIPLRLPLDTWAPPPQFAGKPRTHVDMLLVRVTTSGGVVGWGEAYGSSSPMIPVVFEAATYCPSTADRGADLLSVPSAVWRDRAHCQAIFLPWS